MQTQDETQLRAALNTLQAAVKAARLLCPVLVHGPGRQAESAATCADRRLSLSPDSLYSGMPGHAVENRSFGTSGIDRELMAHGIFSDDDGADGDAALPRALSAPTRERLMLLAHVARREAAVVEEDLRQRGAPTRDTEEALRHLADAKREGAAMAEAGR